MTEDHSPKLDPPTKRGREGEREGWRGESNGSSFTVNEQIHRLYCASNRIMVSVIIRWRT